MVKTSFISEIELKFVHHQGKSSSLSHLEPQHAPFFGEDHEKSFRSLSLNSTQTKALHTLLAYYSNGAVRIESTLCSAQN